MATITINNLFRRESRTPSVPRKVTAKVVSIDAYRGVVFLPAKAPVRMGAAAAPVPAGPVSAA